MLPCVQSLEAVEALTRQLSSSSTPTLSLVIPFVLDVVNRLNDNAARLTTEGKQAAAQDKTKADGLIDAATVVGNLSQALADRFCVNPWKTSFQPLLPLLPAAPAAPPVSASASVAAAGRRTDKDEKVPGGAVAAAAAAAVASAAAGAGRVWETWEMPDEYWEGHRPFLMASALDLRTKTMRFLPQLTERKRVLDLVKGWVLEELKAATDRAEPAAAAVRHSPRKHTKPLTDAKKVRAFESPRPNPSRSVL